jgi:hypothetical protein
MIPIGWRSQTLDVAMILMVLASLGYMRRYTVARPPIGRFTGGDVAVMSVMLIVLPLTYARLPAAAVAAIFGIVFYFAAQGALAPVIGGRAATAVAAVPIAGEIAAKLAGDTAVMLDINDVLLVVAVVGVVNLWAQTGMRAANVAALAVVLTGYDIVTTWLGSFTSDFITKMLSEPFLPLLTVVDVQTPGGFGLGDCLVMTMWPLILLKAYGKRAAWAGGILCLLVAIGIEETFKNQWVAWAAVIPTMAILGPLIVAQYLILRLRIGKERSLAQWQAGVPAGDDPDSAARAHVRATVQAALAASAGDEGGYAIPVVPGEDMLVPLRQLSRDLPQR